MASYKTIKGFAVQTLPTDTFASASDTGSWSSGGTMNTATLRGGGVGTQTASLSIAGVISPNTVSGKTESYNGTAWTELGDLNTTRYIGNFVFGTQTAAIGAGGATAGPGTPTVAVVEQWNGSAWTEVGDLNKAKAQGGGSGTTSGGLIFGGFTFPGSPPTFAVLAETETWNGSAWTEVNDLNAVRYTNTGSKGGSSTASITFGRATSPTAIVENWDGTNWTEVGDLNSGRESIGGSGTSTDGLGFGGTPNTTKTEAYNGTSWTEVADLSVGRSQIGGTGASGSSALAFGGATPSESSATEEWTAQSNFTKINLGQVYYNSGSNAFKVTQTVLGTGAWASGGALNTARNATTGAGTQTAAFMAGGRDASNPTAVHEQYNGTAWTEVADLTVGRRYLLNAGTQTAGLAVGSNSSPSWANVEAWNGSSWSETTEIGTGRGYSNRAGSTGTNVLVVAGYTTTNVGNVESWNGSAWSEKAEMNTPRYESMGGGTYTSAVFGGGKAAPANVANTETWNGSAWTEVADLNTTRAYGGGDGTSSTNALAFGGEEPANSTKTESWNGTAWTELNDLANARGNGMGGAGSNTSALAFGGQDPSGKSTATEEWSIPATVTNKTITVG